MMFVRKILLRFLSALINAPIATIDEIYDAEPKGPVARCVLQLPGKGCEWFKKNGGCSVCGFNKELEHINKYINFSNKNYLALFEIAEEVANVKKAEVLTIYNGGSFLNDKEIPLAIQNNIFCAFRKNKYFKKIVIETRPEYINVGRVKHILDIVRGKLVQVNIGLESADNEIRNKNINKGFDNKAYESACSILKSFGMRVLSYVFLKPPFLDEGEAIKDAIKTIEYAFNHASDEVAIEAAFIQKNTTLERLYDNGEYETPWLWSVIEVVKETHEKGIVRIGGKADFPAPKSVPHNCDKCTDKIYDLFNKYNKNLRFDLFDAIECDCRKQWEAILKKNS